MNMKGLILIYPLRGTNKRASVTSTGFVSDLSPTGDERTIHLCTCFSCMAFIPCGGRTNVRQDVSISRKRIYPLRGTNEPLVSPDRDSFQNLSPTGDEQTPFCFVGSSSPLFIPYGGRKKLSFYFSPYFYVIYSLRGSKKMPIGSTYGHNFYKKIPLKTRRIFRYLKSEKT